MQHKSTDSEDKKPEMWCLLWNLSVITGHFFHYFEKSLPSLPFSHTDLNSAGRVTVECVSGTEHEDVSPATWSSVTTSLWTIIRVCVCGWTPTLSSTRHMLWALPTLARCWREHRWHMLAKECSTACSGPESRRLTLLNFLQCFLWQLVSRAKKECTS